MAGAAGPVFGIYYGYATNDSGWGAAMNTNMQAVDIFLAASVVDFGTVTPPSAPNAGDCYIIGASATGAWSGHDHQVTCYTQGAWVFFPPKTGMTMLAKTSGLKVMYNAAGAWANDPVNLSQGGTSGSEFNSQFIPTDAQGHFNAKPAGGTSGVVSRVRLWATFQNSVDKNPRVIGEIEGGYQANPDGVSEADWGNEYVAIRVNSTTNDGSLSSHMTDVMYLSQTKAFVISPFAMNDGATVNGAILTANVGARVNGGFASDAATIDNNISAGNNIHANANITYGGTISQSSDIRLKNIQRNVTLEDSYKLLDAMQSVVFNYKDRTESHVGFIAQDIEKVPGLAPLVIREKKVVGEDPLDSELEYEEFLRLDSGNGLLAALVPAMQDMRAQLAKLQLS